MNKVAINNDSLTLSFFHFLDFDIRHHHLRFVALAFPRVNLHPFLQPFNRPVFSSSLEEWSL